MTAVGKPHVVCIPFPAQSHIGGMMKLAKLLHHKGFHITFINTELNHNLILKARGPKSLDGLPSFRFKTIPDGQPVSITKQDLLAVIQYFKEQGPALFLNLIEEINDTSGVPPVTCIVSDGFMPFTIPAAEQLELPNILFWTISACSLMGYYQFPMLAQKGLAPLKGKPLLGIIVCPTSDNVSGSNLPNFACLSKTEWKEPAPINTFSIIHDLNGYVLLSRWIHMETCAIASPQHF